MKTESEIRIDLLEELIVKIEKAGSVDYFRGILIFMWLDERGMLKKWKKK